MIHPTVPAPCTAGPTVSVVIATYNGARHVLQTLQSALGQTYPHVEIIVVDDGSTDNTVATVQELGAAIHVIQRTNGGVSAARNMGAKAAHGEFISFLDQDDIWHPRHLQRQLDGLQTWPGAAVVVSPYQHWYPAGDQDTDPAAPLPVEPSLNIDAAYSGWVYHQFLLDCWALTSATTMRKVAFLAAGGFDETRPYAEDWDLWLRLARQVEFAKLQWPPVLYRQHSTQGSRVARNVDYRTELLLNTAKQHGMASRDGRSVSARTFNATIARYRMEFGLHQLQHGSKKLALQALFDAWRRAPLQWRYLAWAMACLLGIRPSRP